MINKASSTTSFSFKDAFRSVSLSAKKLKRFINDSEGKENEKNADVSGWMLTSYVQKNKINKIHNDSDS